MNDVNHTPLGALHQAWTFLGPTTVADDSGTAHFEIRVAELPGFFVAASSEDEVLRELRPALMTYLEALITGGEQVPDLGTPVWLVSQPAPVRRAALAVGEQHVTYSIAGAATLQPLGPAQ